MDSFAREETLDKGIDRSSTVYHTDDRAAEKRDEVKV